MGKVYVIKLDDDGRAKYLSRSVGGLFAWSYDRDKRAHVFESSFTACEFMKGFTPSVEWYLCRADAPRRPGLTGEQRDHSLQGAYPGYTGLEAVLREALEQAAAGKGKDRHANDEPFEDQPILRITEAVGLGFPAGQAIKKIGEAAQAFERKGEADRAIADLLGAINYTAALIIRIKKLNQKEDK